jgi:hypothetical protein
VFWRVNAGSSTRNAVRPVIRGHPTVLFPTPSKGKNMPLPPLALVQGTLDLLVLRALASGPMHGYGIAALVQERTGGDLAVEDAALYQALHRLDRQGLVDAEWRRPRTTAAPATTR